jgi:hypothetical protein
MHSLYGSLHPLNYIHNLIIHISLIRLYLDYSILSIHINLSIFQITTLYVFLLYLEPLNHKLFFEDV